MSGLLPGAAENVLLIVVGVGEGLLTQGRVSAAVEVLCLDARDEAFVAWDCRVLKFWFLFTDNLPFWYRSRSSWCGTCAGASTVGTCRVQYQSIGILSCSPP